MIIIPGSANYSTGKLRHAEMRYVFLIMFFPDVHYSPQGDAVPVGQQMLENFLQGVDSDTTIVGSTDTTPIDSLKLALSEIRLSPVTIPALHQNLITSASLTFPTDIVQTGIASTSFTLRVSKAKYWRTFGNRPLVRVMLQRPNPTASIHCRCSIDSSLPASLSPAEHFSTWDVVTVQRAFSSPNK